MAAAVHAFGCNLCDALCGLNVTVEDGRVLDVRGDPEDVLSHGHVCPKGPALRDLFEDPERLRAPLRRTAGGFEAVSWDAALGEAGERLRSIRERHGPDAIALYIGNPTVHSHRAALGAQLLAVALGTKNHFDANSQDGNPRLFACREVYGDPLCMTVPDIDRIDFLLMLGANPAASNGSMMSLGDVRRRMQGIRARGGRMVLVDPRKNETAAWCDEHVFIRPGADAALLLALLHVVFAEGLVDSAAVDAVASGRAELAAIAQGFAPERVSAACGIPAGTIRRLARELATTPRAAVYGRLGTCQNPFGPVASWLIEALNLVTGHFDREGCVTFARPAADVAPLARVLVGDGFGRWRSRVRGLPEFLGALPSAVMAEEMETPGDGQIRALVCFAGDPVMSTPNGPRLARALAKLDLVVSVDIYLNTTARHAHLVLPPVHVFEAGSFDLLLPMLSVRNTTRYSAPILERPAGALDDWQIMSELALRVVGPRSEWLAQQWRRRTRGVPERVVDLLLRAGHYRLSLGKLAEHPHGLDLGPLVPGRKDKVRTRDGRALLTPPVLVADLARLERWLDAPAPELALIGRRHLRSNNSWMHNLERLVKGPNRAHLLMHPLDAAARGLAGGARAQVASRTGTVEVTVELSDTVMPGVVSLPHGFGHAGEGLAVAARLAAPNLNALTDEAFVEPVIGTSVLNGTPVTVSAV